MNPQLQRIDWRMWLEESLEVWQAEGLLRQLRPVETNSSVHVRSEGRELVLFSGNDYLGLSFHPMVRNRVAESVLEKGMGPRGSALVCGYTNDHALLERNLAELKGTEDALLFPTGFAANLSVLSCLTDSDTAIFSDELNHASLIDGCRSAKQNGAEVHIYAHRDLESLEKIMKESTRPKKLIVTDTVFSMDGDLAPLREIVQLKNELDAWLMVDEAHGTLVFGERGGGVCEQMGISDEVNIQMGTLSKAFGSQGGYVACSEKVKQWLLNRGRTYVFSTALPIPSVAAALEALEVIRTEPEIRNRLWEWVHLFGERIGRKLESPIIPIVIGENEPTLEMSRKLLEVGYHVPGIRPPTVPKGTARLRVALSASHARKEIEGLASLLKAGS